MPSDLNNEPDPIHCHASIDARGLACPLPLMEARRALMLMESGQRLLALATDPASMNDFEEFAEISGHTLLEATQIDGVYRFILEKS